MFDLLCVHVVSCRAVPRFVSTWLLAARRLCRLSCCRFIADASNVGSPACESRLNRSCKRAARAMRLRRPLLHMRLASLPRLSVMHRPEHNIRVQWYSPCNAFAMHAMRPHTSPSGDASQTRSTCKSAVVVVCLERRKGGSALPIRRLRACGLHSPVSVACVLFAKGLDGSAVWPLLYTCRAPRNVM